MRRLWLAVLACGVAVAACGGTDAVTTATSAPSATTATTTASTEASDTGCGHDVDPTIVAIGFNEVVDSDGNVKAPQGRPFQEGDTLRATTDAVTEPNGAAYGQVAAYMMPIRDALMCDVATITEDEWLDLTEILTRNGIRTEQDLSGPPPDQVYSTTGIFEHLRDAEDFNAMMKYLEEAELELKCLAFTDFDFTNPEGENHCDIHGLVVGSGLELP
jgi:hypothetical protein